MLNRCVIYSDSGLTWELLAVRPQTSLGGANAKSLSQRVSETGISGSRPTRHRTRLQECSRAVGKATRADLTRLKRIGRYLLYTPRVV